MDAVCIEQPQRRIQRDTTYRQIFDGQDVMYACRHQATDALLHNPDRISAATALIQARIEECKFLSVRDHSSVECRQLMMVISIALIANDDPYSETVKAAVLKAKRLTDLGGILHNASDKILSDLFQKVIRSFPNKPLKKANKTLNCNLISKYGHASVFSLTKIADCTRNQLLVQIDGIITRKIADDAMREFFPEISAQQY